MKVRFKFCVWLKTLEPELQQKLEPEETKGEVKKENHRIAGKEKDEKIILLEERRQGFETFQKNINILSKKEV